MWPRSPRSLEIQHLRSTMINCPAINSIRNILRKDSMLVECMMSGLPDVSRTCSMSVMNIWCPLLSTAMMISLSLFWSCGYHEVFDIIAPHNRSVVFHILLRISVTSIVLDLIHTKTMFRICMATYQEMGPGITISHTASLS